MTTVQSIDRAFSVLRALLPGPSGVTDIAERVGLPKSTVSRLLSTLEELGAVEQLETGGGYRIGAAMAEFAAAARPGRTLVGMVRPQLLRLSAATGEAAGLSVPDGDSMLYLDQINADTELQVRDWTGTRIPLHAVPSGQVVLAEMPRADRDAYLARELEAFTAATIVDVAVLRARLEQVRRDGFAYSIDEFADGLSSIAAPLRTVDGRVIGALHVYGPSYRLCDERNPAALGALVADAAARVRLD
ncbi:MAG: IclR family transcriptional regulator [Acidimicrobiales bacterium]|nr:IclR family transcriptional regulator [Acidimicrobiales bacterium]MCB9393862.1 IclR family transcriptional regulator [Acidimicrobiaceae bacterium]